jgi:dephospho-CoA kinase
MTKIEKTKIPNAAIILRKIFEENKDKRICVVGSSCVGKSTLLSYFSEVLDMDDILFGNKKKGVLPKLTKDEIDYVCGPWSVEVGEFMKRKARENINIEKERPVFGTIVFDCDLIVEIVVPNEILEKRVSARNAVFSDVLNMKRQIEIEIEKSDKPKIVVENI